jgi:hypothetical protein
MSKLFRSPFYEYSKGSYFPTTKSRRHSRHFLLTPPQTEKTSYNVGRHLSCEYQAFS